MYKIIFSDLDETLLVDHRVPQFNLEAIEKAKLKGIKFVPCTGRAYFLVQDILKDINTYDVQSEYSICFNGGMIVHNKNHEILHFKGLDFKTAQALVLNGDKYDANVLIFTKDRCYMYRPLDTEVERKNRQKCPYDIIDSNDISFLKNDSIAKVLYVRADMTYLKKVVSDSSDFIDTLDVEVTFSSGRYLEFNAKGINKGYGIGWLCNYLGFDVSQSIGIGDNYNDVEMIKTAGLGVAVSSSADDIKQLAGYVTNKDYFEGAVKEVIEKFILEEE